MADSQRGRYASHKLVGCTERKERVIDKEDRRRCPDLLRLSESPANPGRNPLPCKCRSCFPRLSLDLSPFLSPPLHSGYIIRYVCAFYPLTRFAQHQYRVLKTFIQKPTRFVRLGRIAKAYFYMYVLYYLLQASDAFSSAFVSSRCAVC